MAKIAKRFREMPNIEPLLNSTIVDEFLKKFIAAVKVESRNKENVIIHVFPSIVVLEAKY